MKLPSNKKNLGSSRLSYRIYGYTQSIAQSTGKIGPTKEFFATYKSEKFARADQRRFAEELGKTRRDGERFDFKTNEDLGFAEEEVDAILLNEYEPSLEEENNVENYEDR